MPNTHVTWSRETGDRKCPECGSEPILIVASTEWDVPEQEAPSDDTPDWVGVYDEISAHYCLKCGRITSLSLRR
jgi:hypothetical protein